ncbi:MAG TPA: protein kinase [Ktedonobacteraceae bacterium]|nr:protein kinase [Ktedonobacteraceae bacterium]
MSTYYNKTGKLPPQSILHQRYLIIGQTGRGGMSAVYQAVDTSYGNHRVAIKEMSQGNLTAHELADAAARFQQEAALLGSLHHPNLPAIYDGFSEDGRSFLVMEYIDGKTLLQMLKDSGGRPLPVSLVLDYAIQLCDVLIYLHSHNPPIIFRDLKPTNVMVQANGHVVLIDFGIARFFKEGQAQDTVFLGSPGYAPPEQHGTAQTNPRSDLYALGATLHCCLTGRDPFHATDRFAFPPIYQMNPLVPIELDQLIQRLVSLNERQRPNSALEVRQALLRIKQRASDSTTGLDPVMASAPTQYNSLPSTTPVQPSFNKANPAPIQPPTVPVASPAAQIHRTPAVKTPATTNVATISQIWTRGFSILFVAMLLFTVIGSIIAFNIYEPYRSINSNAGLDHAVELGLSVILLLVAIASLWFVQNAAAIIILILTAMFTLGAAFVFLVQTFNDIQQQLPFTLNPVLLNIFSTSSLAASSLISLLWVLRPYLLRDRLILLAIFGLAGICTFLQYSGTDINIAKHIYLLIVLILLIQGVLIAVRTERVRVGRN